MTFNCKSLPILSDLWMFGYLVAPITSNEYMSIFKDFTGNHLGYGCRRWKGLKRFILYSLSNP